MDSPRDYITPGEIDARFETVREILARMDRANEVLSETVNRVPTDLQTAIGNISTVFGNEFTSLRREVDRQNDNNDQVHARMDAAHSAIANGLSAQVADLKARVGTIEAVKTGAKEGREAVYAFVGFVVGAVSIVSVVLALSTR